MRYHKSGWILIAVLSLLASACAGGSSPEAGAPGMGVLRVEGGTSPAAGADGGASDQQSSVIDFGNPGDQSRLEPYIDDPRIRRYYEDEVRGVRIAYPADWTVAEEGEEGVIFTSPDGRGSVAATFVDADSSLEEAMDDATRDSSLDLEPAVARGFDLALKGTGDDGDHLDYEAYAGKAVGDGALVVALRGRIGVKSSWLKDNTISTIPEDGARRPLRLGRNPLPGVAARDGSPPPHPVNDELLERIARSTQYR